MYTCYEACFPIDQYYPIAYTWNLIVDHSFDQYYTNLMIFPRETSRRGSWVTCFGVT